MIKQGEQTTVAKHEKPRAKTLEKKRQILKVALDCFVQQGVEATTIDMIRKASGMSVGSLYHHFGNKEKIAASVFIQGMRDFGQLTQRYLEQIHTRERRAEAGVNAVVYANVDWISDNPDWARFVFQHRASVARGEAEETLQQDTQSFYHELIDWFTPFLQQGTLKPLPIELLSSLISGPTHDYARHWLAGRYKTPLKEYREVLADAAWQAVKGY